MTKLILIAFMAGQRRVLKILVPKLQALRQLKFVARSLKIQSQSKLNLDEAWTNYTPPDSLLLPTQTKLASDFNSTLAVVISASVFLPVQGKGSIEE
jgi:hypothetical protein